MKFKKRRSKKFSRKSKPKKECCYVLVVEYGDIGFSPFDLFTEADLELMRNPPDVFYSNGKYYVTEDDLPF